MPNLYIILCIETTTHVLPDYVVSMTTGPRDYKPPVVWDRGSYTKSVALDLTNDMIHTIFADVQNLLHAPPYVALKKTTFDLTEANTCFQECRNRLPTNGTLRDLENGNVAHVNTANTKWTWLLRIAVVALMVKDLEAQMSFDGRDFSDYGSSDDGEVIEISD